MMRRTLLLCLLLLLTCAGARAESVALINARLLSLETGAWSDARTVLIEGERIVAIGDELAIPDDAQVIDASGLFVIPGLIDSHVHLFDEGDCTLMLAHGVTSALNMAGSRMHLQLRDRAGDGEVLPTILTTGPMLKTEASPLVEFEEVVLTRDAAEAAVRAYAAAGYDFIKVWGPVSPEVYGAIMATARDEGVRVTGHIPRDVGLEGVLEAGQSSIAHVEEFLNKHFDREDPSDAALREAAELVAAAGVRVITTLITYEAIAGSVAADPDPLLSRPERELLDPMRQLLWTPDFNRFRSEDRVGEEARFRDLLLIKQRIALALHEAGAPLLAGTDAGELPGLVPGADLHRELEVLVASGLSPLEALRSATSVPGAYLFPEGPPVGVIREGARADLVLLRADPLEDISNTRTVDGVIVRGHVLSRVDLDARLEALRERNQRTGLIMRAAFESGAAEAEAVFRLLGERAPDKPALALAPGLFLAYALAAGGDMEGAIGVLRLTSAANPDAPEPLYMLAGAALASGDRAAAIAGFERVLQVAPDHERARRELKRLRDER